jgi:hypothetical protein
MGAARRKKHFGISDPLVSVKISRKKKAGFVRQDGVDADGEIAL